VVGDEVLGRDHLRKPWTLVLVGRYFDQQDVGAGRDAAGASVSCSSGELAARLPPRHEYARGDHEGQGAGSLKRGQQARDGLFDHAQRPATCLLSPAAYQVEHVALAAAQSSHVCAMPWPGHSAYQSKAAGRSAQFGSG
jgi:hypothetical protein